jgi:glycosyltransferase involved in cell wall biosynthesis
MKIAILFDLASPQMGGSYTFNKMIFDVVGKYRNDKKHDFLTIYREENSIGIRPDICMPTRAEQKFYFIKTFLKQLFSKKFISDGINLEICHAAALNSIIEKNQIDVVWAVQPLGVRLACPYITTSWDIAHRITPYLPEFSKNLNEVRNREKVAASVFAGAYKVVVGTNRGKNELESIYGLTEERLLVNPFPQVVKFESTNIARRVNRIIYPANFWPHKNHIVLIKAINLLRDSKALNVELVLTGSDSGSLGQIKTLIENMSLSDNVDLRGFVSVNELSELYSSSSLLVFPTLIGPDNLPPLEALAHGCKVTVSDIPGAREQFGAFATYFDPYDVNSVAEAVEKGLTDQSVLFSKEDLEAFLNALNPQGYVDSVVHEIEKLTHLTESM